MTEKLKSRIAVIFLVLLLTGFVTVGYIIGKIIDGKNVVRKLWEKRH